MQTGDPFVVVLIVALMLVWLFVAAKRKYRNRWRGPDIPPHSEVFVPSDEAVRLLEEAGYDILAGKVRLPVYVELDGNVMESRLFIDAFAEKDGETYVVRLARERKPIEMTGSSLRDHLLVYHLLYPQTAGVLYVDLPAGAIRVVKFEVER